jgi:hypothetical protein
MKECDMLDQPSDSFDEGRPVAGFEDAILLWRLPKQMNCPRLPGEPFGRCYLRVQTLGARRRVFFSVIQEEAPPLEPHLLWLAGLVTRLFSPDVFATRWFLHTPAGLQGLSMDSFAEMVFDWTAGAWGPVASRLSWQEAWTAERRPIELPGLYESDKELVWINSLWPGGYGHCGLRRVEGGAGKETQPQETVILTNRGGKSVINGIEEIAVWVRDVFGPAPADTTWVTHFEAADHPLGEETYIKAGLQVNGVAWEHISRREGRALLARSRSFQLPLGPVAPLGDPLILDHLTHRQDQSFGRGRQYAGDAAEGGNFVFVHENGTCRRLQNVCRWLDGQLFLWGNNAYGAHGLAYSILADLYGRDLADHYWKPFHEEIIGGLASDADFTLAQEAIESWLQRMRRREEVDSGAYLN